MAIKRVMVKDLTDKEAFTSQEMKDYLTHKADAMHKAWNIPSVPCNIYYDPNDQSVAYTDNRQYMLNAGHEIVTGTRPEKLSFVCGMLMHEIGHRLFTSFTAMKRYMVAIAAGKLYPGKPKMSRLYERNLEELLDYISDEMQAIKFGSVAKQLVNILEDARIEYFLMGFSEEYYTLGKGLQNLRNVMYDHLDPYPVLQKKMEDKQLLPFEAFIQILLHYGRFGEIKGFTPSKDKDRIIELFDRVQPYADHCIEAVYSLEFYRSLNPLLVLLWPDIKEYLDQIEDEMQNEDQEQDSSTPQGPPGAKAVAEKISQRIGQLQGLTPDSSESMSGSGSDASETAEQLQEKDDDNGEGAKAAPPYTRTTSIGSQGTGMTTFSNEKDADRNIQMDMNRLLTAVAARKTDEALERQIKQDLNDFKGKINFPAVHKNVNCEIVRFRVTDNNRREYERISPPLLRIAKNLAKQTDFFSEDESPITVKSQFYGKRFNSSSVAKADYRYFSRDVILEEAPTVAVAVCIDESGSMCGNREQAAKAMGITILEYCRLMEIPIAIYGHTTGGNGVKLSAYADFDKPDPNDRFRLMNSLNPQGNRDGYALRFLKERLEAQDATSKLLLIVSDGRPADFNYMGTAANKDLQDIVQDCERQGIGIIAAAIGEDKAQIKAIYGEKHFMDITDLNTLPIALAKKIRLLLK